MTSLSIRDAIISRLATDHAKRIVRDAVVAGESDWQAAMRGLVCVSRQHGGPLPAGKAEEATTVLLAFAAQVRAAEAQRIAAEALQAGRLERGERPS